MEYQVLSEDCRKSLDVKSEKKYGLPSVKKWHSAKEPLCWVSGADTRHRINGGYRPLTVAALCRVLLFDTRQTWSLPSVILCRVFGTRQTTFLPSVICLPSALSLALGKQLLYRVPDKKHSAKSGTLGKEAVSGSEPWWCHPWCGKNINESTKI